MQPPAGERPVQWYLLTTQEVTTLEQAIEVVGYYVLRWRVEDMFRVTAQERLCGRAAGYAASQESAQCHYDLYGDGVAPAIDDASGARGTRSVAGRIV